MVPRLLGIFVLFFACASPEREFEDAYAQAQCAYLVRCSDYGRRDNGICHPKWRTRNRLGLGLPTQFDPNTAAACLVSFAASTENCGRISRSCSDALVVGRSENALCASDQQCRPDLRCALALVGVAGCVGRCVPRTRGVGDSCRGNAECQSERCVDGACAAFANLRLGEPCTFNSDCAGTAICSSASGRAPTCTPVARADGIDCDEERICPSGFTCESLRCARLAEDSRPGPGQRCTPETECPPAFSCHSGVCRARGYVGDRCADGWPCLVGSCVDRICTRLPAGASCSILSGTRECEHGCGLDGVCVERANVGEPCAPAGCADEATCVAGRCVPGLCEFSDETPETR